MNYKKQIVKFDTAKMINLSLVMFILPMIGGILLNILVFGGGKPVTGKLYIDTILVVILTVVFVIVHELIHAIGFIIFGKAKKGEVSFGILPKQGMVYCSCNKPMEAKNYLLALIFPIIITGIIPFIFVVIYANFIWVFMFAVLISGGAGDLIMFNEVRKRDAKQLIIDHPKAPAYYLVYESGKEPEDFVEATQEMEEEMAKEVTTSPFKGKNSKKSLGYKIIKIIIFLGISFLVLLVIGLVLTS